MVYDGPKYRPQPNDDHHNKRGNPGQPSWDDSYQNFGSPPKKAQPSVAPKPPKNPQLNLFEANGIDFNQFNTPRPLYGATSQYSSTPAQSSSQSKSKQLDLLEQHNFGENNIDPSLVPRPQMRYSRQDPEIKRLLSIPLKPSASGEELPTDRRLPRSNIDGELKTKDLRQALSLRQLSEDGKGKAPQGLWMPWDEQKQRAKDGTLATGQSNSELRSLMEYLETHPEAQRRGTKIGDLLAQTQAFEAKQAQSAQGQPPQAQSGLLSGGVQVAVTELTPGMFAPPEGKSTVPPQLQSTPSKDPTSPDLLAQRSFVVPHASDVKQQVLTQKPMQSMTDLEAAAIQQHYRFQGADFARWVVGHRQQDEASRAAYEAEFKRLGDGASVSERMYAASRVGGV
jgi:hypothetical protein